MKYGFEFFVAWRYLRSSRRSRAGYWTMLVGALLLTGAGVSYELYHQLMGIHPFELTEHQALLKQIYQWIWLACSGSGLLVFIFGAFHSLQSIFTTISTFGVFLGTAALVIVLSVMNGFEDDLRQKILGTNAHILITKEDGPFTEYHDVSAQLEGLCAGACVIGHSPYLSSEVVVAANSNYGTVIIKGIDPATVGKVTDLVHNVTPGSIERMWPKEAPATAPAPTGEPPDFNEDPPDFDDEATRAHLPDAGVAKAPAPLRPAPRPLRPDPRVATLDGILVGRELAKNLRLYEDEEVSVVSPVGQDTPTGQMPRTRPFRVAGVFFTGMYEYDAKIVYVTVPALQRFLSLGDEVTGVEIKVSDIERTQPVVDAIQARLGPAYRVRDWKEINKSLFSALKLEQIAMFLVLTIIILVASFSIISNLIMVVVEKGREIATLKSMGASDWAIMRIFVAEGAFIGVLGTAVGITVGLACCLVTKKYGLPLDSDVYYIDRLPVAISPFAITAIACAGVLISIVATIYPAYVGARLRPIDGLRQ